MAKELYLYTEITPESIEALMSDMEDCSPDDMTIRLCSPGGDLFAAWGLYAKMQETPGEVHLKVDGLAASAAAYAPLFADKTTALETSTFMLHRADGPVKSESDQEFLDAKNQELRTRLEDRIDGKKLKELKGVSIKDMFEAKDRKDVYLTAKEAKAIGLINDIVKVNAKDIKAINSRLNSFKTIKKPMAIAAVTKPVKMDKMNVDNFKAKYPKTYAKVLAAGAAAEKERIEGILVYAHVDEKLAKETIESGKTFTAKQIGELVLKANSPEILKKIAAAAAPTVVAAATPVVTEKTEKEKELEVFEKTLRTSLKLDKEVK